MKKLIALLLAVTTVISFTGCGTDETSETENSGVSVSDKVKDESSKAKDEDSSGEKSEAVSETSAADKDKSDSTDSKKTEITKDDETEIIELMKRMYQAVTDGDHAAVLRCMMPNELVDCLISAGLGEQMGSLRNDYEGIDTENITIASVDEVEVDADINNILEKYYSMLIKAFGALKEMGIDMNKAQQGGYSEEEMAKIQEAMGVLGGMEDFEDMEQIESLIKVVDAKSVEFTGLKDSEGESLVLYKIDGEGWKIDSLITTMLSYVNKSQKQVAAAEAKTICNAANTALVDIDEAGNSIFLGTRILSPDSSLNKFSSNADRREDSQMIFDGMESYMDSVDKYKYFIVVNDSQCKYVVLERNGVIGTYPSKVLLTYNDGVWDYENADLSKYTFEEIYEETASLLK